MLPTLGAYVHHRRKHWGVTGHYSASLAYGRTDWLPYGSGDARFTWYTGRLVACPLGHTVQGFSYGICALSEVGWLQGRGSSAMGEQSAGGPWLAPGLGLTTDLVFRQLELGWDAGLVAPLLRDHYYFVPNETVFQPKKLGLVAELRLGWVFR